GTAFGLYNAVLGVGALVASVLFGVVWTEISPGAAFFMGGALALVAALLLVFVPSPRPQPV
ncbi:MAG: MFS transporter, partial [Acidobacteriota bacterium]